MSEEIAIVEFRTYINIALILSGVLVVAIGAMLVHRTNELYQRRPRTEDRNSKTENAGDRASIDVHIKPDKVKWTSSGLAQGTVIAAFGMAIILVTAIYGQPKYSWMKTTKENGDTTEQIEIKGDQDLTGIRSEIFQLIEDERLEDAIEIFERHTNAQFNNDLVNKMLQIYDEVGAVDKHQALVRMRESF